MKNYLFLFISFLMTASVSDACMSTKGKETWSRQRIQKSFLDSKRKPATQVVRFAEGSAQASLEAQLGNLLLQLQSEFPKGFIMSMPAKMERSTYHPFGDGQSNAKMSFAPHWKEKDFPVVGIQSSESGKASRSYRFHPSLQIKSYKETDLGNGWYKVQPQGWLDAFYFSYDASVLSVNQFVAGIPEKLRQFPGHRVAPNPAKIAKDLGLQKMMKDLGAGYSKDPWPASSVHGFFPDEKGEKTALGGVLTWGIVQNSQGPFKHLYTCFEGRRLKEEAQTGIPSGAGWHHIGDAGETLLNTLEQAEIPVAVGRTHNNSDAAYKLTETVTATWLKSDEALVSLQGTFHWYLNPSESAVCTEIWVHNCVPTLDNSWGFNCPWK